MTAKKTEAYNDILPTRLRHILDSKKIKQVDLAKNTGIARQQIGNYADGKSTPNGETIAKLARALDVSSDYLLGLNDDENPYKKKGLSTYGDIIKSIIDIQNLIDCDFEVREFSGFDKDDVPRIIFTIYDQNILDYFLQVNATWYFVNSSPENMKKNAEEMQARMIQLIAKEKDLQKIVPNPDNEVVWEYGKP